MAMEATPMRVRGDAREVTPIRVRGDALHAMRAHARATHGHECCGALLGCASATGRTVEAVVPLANEAPETTRRYLIPATRVRTLERRAAEAGLDVVGFFHSHPDGTATPSAEDLDHAWPWYSYVIVPAGRDSMEPRSWRLRPDRGGFRPEAIEWLA